MLQTWDREKLQAEFSNAKPFPFVKIDNFIDPMHAAAIAAAYPSFDDALSQGTTFSTINERRKIQISDSSTFSEPIFQLNELLASSPFLSDLSYITGIPKLLADEQLVGGGIHVTGPGGRLDVHIDFNFIKERNLHRRLNLLLYLNPEWQENWGGQLQLWDESVKHCEAAFAPTFNRCVIFETSEISYHGVLPVSADALFPRRSFATYYYTKEAPANWTGVSHSTVFKARPSEKLKGTVLMPAEMAKRKVDMLWRKLKTRLRAADPRRH